MYLEIMFNPALTKELIKGKENKYSSFCCRSHDTTVKFHGSKLFCCLGFDHWTGNHSLGHDKYVTSSMKKNTASEKEANSGAI